MPTSSAFFVGQQAVDQFLRYGGNTDQLRMRVIHLFQMDIPLPLMITRLQALYHGGNGITTEHGPMAAWYDEDGIHLANGDRARYEANAQVIPWESVAQRIGELLEAGQFASNVELLEADGYERSLLAESLIYLYRDLNREDHPNDFLPCLTDGAKWLDFPKDQPRLSDLLADPDFRKTLLTEYRIFLAAYQEDRSIMRFHYHDFRGVLNRLEELDLPRKTFSTTLTELPAIMPFITEDEIDEALSGGSHFEGGPKRIYGFFQELHDTKEKADFLRKEYGTGGHSHALSRSGYSHEDYDSKGIRFTKRNCPEINLSWVKVAHRIENLVRKDRYLSPEAMAEYEDELASQEVPEGQESAPMQYNAVKERYPDHVVLFQVGDFYELYGEDAKALAPELGLTLTTRPVPGVGRVEMCGLPAHRLEHYTNRMRRNHDVLVSSLPEGATEHRETVMERFSGPRRYQIPLGSTVYIGTKPYEMQSLGETTVTLYDPEFPLFTQEFPRADFDRKLEENPLNEQYFLPDMPQEQAQPTNTRDYGGDYRLLDRLRTDCEYFLGKGQRNEKHLWAGNVSAQIHKMRELYDALPEKPDWLTREQIEDYADRMAARYQVAVYHHFENGFDERLDYQTLEEAERVAQGYVDGSMEDDGFRYDGAAVYDLKEERYRHDLSTTSTDFSTTNSARPNGDTQNIGGRQKELGRKKTIKDAQRSKAKKAEQIKFSTRDQSHLAEPNRHDSPGGGERPLPNAGNKNAGFFGKPRRNGVQSPVGQRETPDFKIPAGKDGNLKTLGQKPGSKATRPLKVDGNRPKLGTALQKRKAPFQRSKTVQRQLSPAQQAKTLARRRAQKEMVKKAGQRTKQAATKVGKATIRFAQAVGRVALAAIKGVIAAGGGVILLIVLLCLILVAAIAASPFGIFFAGGGSQDGVPVSVAVAQVNYAYNETLEELQTAESYDDVVIEGTGADWVDVLAVFAVKVAGSNDTDATDVVTLDENRIDRLEAVFWDMNTIIHEVDEIDHPESSEGADDGYTERILHINITGKTAEEAAAEYNFTTQQLEMLQELLEEREMLADLIGSLMNITADAKDVLLNLPEDLSPEREAVIRAACSLVGKVNYFWGGKSLVLGWDSRWGRLTEVTAAGNSTTGTYRPYGLDCSGFVDWVFYNATGGEYIIGHGGGAMAQQGYCTSISWAEAQIGDLVFYPEDTHVGIVCGWDESGNILIVHCAFSANNVVITGQEGFTTIGRPVFYGGA